MGTNAWLKGNEKSRWVKNDLEWGDKRGGTGVGGMLGRGVGEGEDAALPSFLLTLYAN